jgi:PAS domain S-box-containing protein
MAPVDAFGRRRVLYESAGRTRPIRPCGPKSLAREPEIPGRVHHEPPTTEISRSCSHGGVLDRSLIAVTDVVATIPGLMFSIKGADGTYVYANQAFADRAGVAGPGDVVGRTARDLFPAELAERYEAQDRRVLATGRMLTNELELIPRSGGSVGWYLTSKSRWTDDDGVPIGVIAASLDLHTSASAAAHPHLADAVALARARVGEAVTIADLAVAAQMDVAHFERACRRVLSISPKQLLMRCRIEEALRLLETTDHSVARIAEDCGYFDQSAFTRHFRRVVGATPAAWRAQLGRTAPTKTT